MRVTCSVRARLAAALALAGVLLVAAPALVPAAASAAPDPALTADAPVRVLVTYRTTADRAAHEASAVLPGDGSRLLRSYAHFPVVALEVTAAARQRLAASPDVVAIEPDRQLEATDDGGGPAPAAAAPQPSLPIATGAGWTVAVLDTGVDTNHPYLAGRTGPGVDGQGDGGACFATDCPTGATGVASAQPCAASGCDHGTHVAGIAVGDPSKVSTTGVHGMAPGAALYPVRVFSTATCGSSVCAKANESDVLAGLDHVLTESAHYRFASVNLSLGDDTTYASPCAGSTSSQGAIVTAIGDVRDAGIAVAVAAGNQNVSTGVSFPACADGAIAVAALDASGTAIAGFSDASAKVALAAPGTNILSSEPGNAFALKSGTSMAAPAVAGAFALLRQAAPTASLASLLDLLRSTGGQASDSRSGATYPSLNVDAALRTLGYASPGGTPTLSAAFAGLSTPQRLVDTRDGLGGNRLAAGATLAIAMPARPSSLGTSPAASLNVTAVGATVPGYLTLYPCGGTTPLVSSVNYAGPAPVANKVVVTVPADGRVCLYTMSAADIIIDLDGWLPAEQPFHAVAPRRVLDTRQTSGPVTDVAVPVAPSGATGAVVNVTVTDPDQPGFATVYPCGSTPPLASNLNFVAGETVPAEALVPVDSTGRVCVHTSTPAHIVIDVAGWLQSGFVPVVPFRAIDTRSLGPPVTDLVVAPGSLTGVAGVALTLTITEPTAAGYATVYPCGQAPPLVSNLNFVAGQTVANAVVTMPDPQGRICVHTLVPTHVVVDISGTFS